MRALSRRSFATSQASKPTFSKSEFVPGTGKVVPKRPNVKPSLAIRFPTDNKTGSSGDTVGLKTRPLYSTDRVSNGVSHQPTRVRVHGTTKSAFPTTSSTVPPKHKPPPREKQNDTQRSRHLDAAPRRATEASRKTLYSPLGVEGVKMSVTERDGRASKVSERRETEKGGMYQYREHPKPIHSTSKSSLERAKFN